MNTTPIPPANSCLNYFLPSNPEDQRKLAPVFGYLELGMPTMALGYLTSTPGQTMETGELEALRLLTLERAGMASRELADEAVRSAHAFPENLEIIEMAFIHLTASEQYQRVFQFYQSLSGRERCRWHPSILHNLAVAATQMGRYKKGLAFAYKSACVMPGVSPLLVLDLQLRPLWEHYASADFGDTMEARWMCSKPMLAALGPALEREAARLTVCDFTVNQRVPSDFHPWLERCLSSHYVLRENAPKSVRNAYHSWLGAWRAEGIHVFKAAIQNAFVYLDALAPVLKSGGAQKMDGESPAL